MQFQRLPWPPTHDSTSQRLRGFYPKTISDRNKLRDFLAELDSFKDRPNSTRLSVRAIVHTPLILSIGRFGVEAVLPLRRSPEYSLVYLAYNAPGRLTHLKKLKTQAEELAGLQADFRGRAIAELKRQAIGYELATHPALDIATAEQIRDLFAVRFLACPEPMSVDNIMNMSSTSVIVTAKNAATGELAGVFMGDLSFADIEGQALRMVEFNHVLAKSGAPHQALIPLMAFLVIKETTWSSPIIFAEAHADVLALQAACLTVGMQYCGTMRASFLMVHLNEKSGMQIFKNAHVWHLPEARRIEILGELG